MSAFIQQEAFDPVVIKAYRVKGGAIVGVQRYGRVRRYKVGLARFNALKRSLSFAGWHGSFFSSSMDARP